MGNPAFPQVQSLMLGEVSEGPETLRAADLEIGATDRLRGGFFLAQGTNCELPPY